MMDEHQRRIIEAALWKFYHELLRVSDGRRAKKIHSEAIEFFLRRDKRIRAEVLVSVVAYLKMCGEECMFPQHKQAYKNAAEVVATLQPAAADLEELLREARLEELRAFHPAYCEAAKRGHIPDYDYPCCGTGKRIAELENELKKRS